MQLNIFDHNRDVMLRNDVLQVLEQHDAARSRAAWETLHQEYAKDESPPALQCATDDDTLACLRHNSFIHIKGV